MLKCTQCNTVYPDAYRARWGKFPESDGEGSQPKCVGLVDSGLPPVQNPRTLRWEKPQQRCGGALTFTEAAVTPGLGERVAKSLEAIEQPVELPAPELEV